jgi:outer membrane protein OmpA-like peptidoglycan-associated protein
MTFGRNDVALRAGFHTASTQDLGGVAGLTAGIGIAHRFDDFSAALDYAYEPYGILGDTHRISLTVIIGGELTKPLAYVSGPPAFVLGQNSIPVNFSTKSEEPISHWKITVTDPTGMLVFTQSGNGNPPSRWIWQGKNQAGDLVPQGNYTVNLEVADDNDLTGKTEPHNVYAKWVPKEVPYSYAFSVPGDLLFDSAKADLQPRGYETIKNAVAALKQRYPNSVIIIAGNTDNQKLAKGAKFADNQQLSLARAQAVRDFLVREGMDPAKLQVQGFGDTKPIADNATKEGRAKNRRVDLIVSGMMTAGPERLIADGREMMAARRYRDALDRFLKAIQADSRNGKAYHLAGDCYLILGGKDQAIQSYRKALQYDPNDTPVKAWLDKYAPSSNPAPSSPPAGSAPTGSTPSGGGQPAPQGLTPLNPASSTPPPNPAAPSDSAASPAGIPQPVQ